MEVDDNTRVVLTENGTDDYDHADVVTLSDTDYHDISDLGNCEFITDLDADSTLGGRQLYLDLFYQIPNNAAGVYGTSFGIRSSELNPGSTDGPQILDYTTSC